MHRSKPLRPVDGEPTAELDSWPLSSARWVASERADGVTLPRLKLQSSPDIITIAFGSSQHDDPYSVAQTLSMRCITQLDFSAFFHALARSYLLYAYSHRGEVESTALVAEWRRRALARATIAGQGGTVLPGRAGRRGGRNALSRPRLRPPGVKRDFDNADRWSSASEDESIQTREGFRGFSYGLMKKVEPRQRQRPATLPGEGVEVGGLRRRSPTQAQPPRWDQTSSAPATEGRDGREKLSMRSRGLSFAQAARDAFIPDSRKKAAAPETPTTRQWRNSGTVIGSPTKSERDSATTSMNTPATRSERAEKSEASSSSHGRSRAHTVGVASRGLGHRLLPRGRGIGHQVMVEEGYAFPQTLAVASDSHSNMYGGVGCVGTPVVRTDAAAIWATGQTWWQIPEVVKVELSGQLPPGVTGKDVIVALCGYFNEDQVLNAAIEFTGSGLSALTIDERLAISNMTTEWGALAGVFPVDDVTLSWYEGVIRKMDKLNFQMGSSPSLSAAHPRLNMERLDNLSRNLVKPDQDAFYSKHLRLDLSTLSPHVSGPNSVKVSTPLTTLASQNIDIQKAYLVSCVNSRASDLKAAADVIRGKKVASGVEFYVAAASSVVQRQSEESGDWGALMAAGAKPLPAGCGPCIGLGVGLLEDGEVGISATNRNYKGRMGSPKAQAYLASPAVVAASAVEGKICGPADLDPALLPGPDALQFSIQTAASEISAESPAPPEAQDTPLLPGFPALFKGPLIFAPQDNLNTDGIYPGKYTYQDDITPERQAQVVMENYDPQFAATVASLRSSGQSEAEAETKSGVILVGGYNFGTGSSREQAATALKHAGCPWFWPARLVTFSSETPSTMDWFASSARSSSRISRGNLQRKGSEDLGARTRARSACCSRTPRSASRARTAN
ncbi:hypothetical protein L7F22_037697 [Adiantum nelumboides]|nr:hypothetical protein [Adiantum nelumboides]